MSTVIKPEAEAITRTNGAPKTYGTAPLYEGEGWVLFSGIILLVSAVLDGIWGIAAVSKSHFFAGDATFILSGLNTWGWVAIALAAVQVLVAFSIWRGGSFGRWAGIAVAGLAILAAMMSIPAYPIWSLILVAMYVLVIYGLAAYGGKPGLAP